jgi:hypothetical protein
VSCISAIQPRWSTLSLLGIGLVHHLSEEVACTNVGGICVL